MKNTHTTHSNTSRTVLRSATLFFCIIIGLCIFVPESHASLTMQATSYHTGGTSPCGAEPNQGTVTYVLSTIQGNAYSLGTHVYASPGATLVIAGTVSHVGCGNGGVTLSANGQTDGLEIDEDTNAPLTVSFTVPETPGTYSFSVVVWAVTGEGNFVTSTITLFYRVAHPPRLLICPDGAQTITQLESKQYETRYWNTLAQAPDCSLGTYDAVVTHASNWMGGNDTIITVGNSTVGNHQEQKGVATGIQQGSANIYATYAGVDASRLITVTAGTPQPTYKLQVCVEGVLLAVDAGVVERTLGQGLHEEVQVYYDETLDCAGTDISATTMSDTHLPADVVSLTHSSPTRVDASVTESGIEQVLVQHGGNTITVRYGVLGAPTPTCIGSFEHASICPDDHFGLMADVQSTLVSTCTALQKCEYFCVDPYVKSGNACILTGGDGGGNTFIPQ